ncbi:MAG: hypothetical protein HZB26_13295 [Candidatus Hydrogenedentes bacterium]|nr:hypothetical protein [Candidatus Hydrogenedentota bacterium]
MTRRIERTKRQLNGIALPLCLLLMSSLALTGCPSVTQSVDIHRVFHSSTEEEMLQIAESTYPARADVVAAAGPDAARLPSQYLWWYRDISFNVHAPYAITAESIVHYTGVVQHLDEIRNTAGGRVWLFGHFQYHATVDYRASYVDAGQQFENVYVVTMDMALGLLTSRTASVGFTKERVVVLNAAGEVLAIFGDGLAEITAT